MPITVCDSTGRVPVVQLPTTEISDAVVRANALDDPTPTMAVADAATACITTGRPTEADVARLLVDTPRPPTTRVYAQAFAFVGDRTKSPTPALPVTFNATHGPAPPLSEYLQNGKEPSEPKTTVRPAFVYMPEILLVAIPFRTLISENPAVGLPYRITVFEPVVSAHIV